MISILFFWFIIKVFFNLINIINYNFLNINFFLLIFNFKIINTLPKFI